jgi:hypothetical protein
MTLGLAIPLAAASLCTVVPSCVEISPTGCPPAAPRRGPYRRHVAFPQPARPSAPWSPAKALASEADRRAPSPAACQRGRPAVSGQGLEKAIKTISGACFEISAPGSRTSQRSRNGHPDKPRGRRHHRAGRAHNAHPERRTGQPHLRQSKLDPAPAPLWGNPPPNGFQQARMPKASPSGEALPTSAGPKGRGVLISVGEAGAC